MLLLVFVLRVLLATIFIQTPRQPACTAAAAAAHSLAHTQEQLLTHMDPQCCSAASISQPCPCPALPGPALSCTHHTAMDSNQHPQHLTASTHAGYLTHTSRSRAASCPQAAASQCTVHVASATTNPTRLSCRYYTAAARQQKLSCAPAQPCANCSPFSTPVSMHSTCSRLTHMVPQVAMSVTQPMHSHASCPRAPALHHTTPPPPLHHPVSMYHSRPLVPV
jgi:hypothetical protein